MIEYLLVALISTIIATIAAPKIKSWAEKAIQRYSKDPDTADIFRKKS